MNILIIFLVFSIAAVTHANISSLKIKANGDMVDFFKKVILKKIFTKIMIDDVTHQSNLTNGTNHHRVATLTSIVGKSIGDPEGNLTITEPNLGIFTIYPFDIMLTGQWESILDYEVVQLPENMGTFEANLTVSYTVEFQMTSSNGQLVAPIGHCSTKLLSLQVGIEEENMLDWPVPLFTKLLQQKIGFENELCNSFKKTWKTGAYKYIHRDNLGLRYYNSILDLSVMSTMVVENTSFVIGLNGSSYIANQHNMTFPYTPMQLPEFSPSNSSIQLMAGQYMAETALYSFYENGDIAITLDQRRIPPVLAGIYLSTTLLGVFIPALRKIARPIEIYVEAIAPIRVKMNPSNVVLGGTFDITVIIIELEGTSDAFTVTLDLNVTGKIGANESIINSFVDDYEYELSVKTTNIGEINLEQIKYYINSYLSHDGLRLANEFLQKGVKVGSVFGLTFTEFHIKHHEKALEVEANLVRVDTNGMPI